jgi:serine/threonine protein kinase
MAPLHELLPQLKDSQLYVFKEVCRAVHYLHTKKILHRDIKPSNIFATEEGKIKLGDFGISTEFKPSMTP